jgi:hypothetical protein
VPPLAARETLARTVAEQCRRKRENSWVADAYGAGNAAERVAAAIATHFNLSQLDSPSSDVVSPTTSFA